MLENPFLQGLTPQQYSLLSALFVPVHVPARAVIFRQGDRAEHAYLLVRGRIAIRYTPYDGPSIILTRLRSGDVFGWSAVLGSPTYTADAEASTAAEIWRMRGVEIRELCVRHPIAGAQLLDKLALAVAPRWKDSQGQVRQLLKQEMLENPEHPTSG